MAFETEISEADARTRYPAAFTEAKEPAVTKQPSRAATNDRLADRLVERAFARLAWDADETDPGTESQRRNLKLDFLRVLKSTNR